MVVVNIVGFPYKIKLRDGTYIIVPFDNQPHEVPDEIAEYKFENVFNVLVPPKPKNQLVNTFESKLESIVNKETEMIEIDIKNKSEEDIVFDELKDEQKEDIVVDESKDEQKEDIVVDESKDEQKEDIVVDESKIVVQENNSEIKRLPLKGVKIKNREKFIKKNKTIENTGELNNANN